MKNDREFTGTLLGFDDFVSESFDHFSSVVGTLNALLFSTDMVLEDVIE
jgi:small nuclear ribonucleoprotein (snRNP)-like protein